MEKGPGLGKMSSKYTMENRTGLGILHQFDNHTRAMCV